MPLSISPTYVPSKELFCRSSWKILWPWVPTTQTTPTISSLRGSTCHPLPGPRKSYQPIVELQNSIMGLNLHPTLKKCEILILGIFKAIQCISNGFLNQLLHFVGRNLINLHWCFPHRYAHTNLWLPCVPFFWYSFQKFHHWLPALSERYMRPRKFLLAWTTKHG